MRKIILLSLFVFTLILSCFNNDSKKEPDVQKQLKKSKIVEFANKYNASINWKKNWSDRFELYTFEIQKYFETHNKPILIEAELEDINYIDGTYLLELDDIELDFYYRLSCNYSIVEKILQDSSSFFLFANCYSSN